MSDWNSVEKMRERHRPHGTIKTDAGWAPGCAHCGFPWPCDAKRLLDMLAGQR